MKNHFRITNLRNPISITEAASKYYVDIELNDLSIIKSTTHVDFNDENLDNVRFIKIKQLSNIRRTCHGKKLCSSKF